MQISIRWSQRGRKQPRVCNVQLLENVRQSAHSKSPRFSMAYSCMMVMAYGFQQAVHNSTNTTLALQKLSKNKMGNQLQLSTFNTSFVGPSGPMIFDQNGDVMLASFSLYNIQNGNQVKIGKYIAGELTLTSPPIYHDGSSTVIVV